MGRKHHWSGVGKSGLAFVSLHLRESIVAFPVEMIVVCGSFSFFKEERGLSFFGKAE